MQFKVLDPNYERRVRDSFARQAAMTLIGATMTHVEPGRCEIELPVREELTQQHRFVHGGVVGMIADSAGGYAAFTLMPADASVLTVEFKINMLAPAKGERLLALAPCSNPAARCRSCAPTSLRWTTAARRWWRPCSRRSW